MHASILSLPLKTQEFVHIYDEYFAFPLLQQLLRGRKYILLCFFIYLLYALFYSTFVKLTFLKLKTTFVKLKLTTIISIVMQIAIIV